MDARLARRTDRAWAGSPSACGDGSHVGGQSGQGVGVHGHGVDVGAEVVDPQRRREARRAGGGQDVVGAGHVVAHAGRGVGAEEHRAGAPHERKQFRRRPSTSSSRCSGATTLATATAWAGPSTRTT